MAKAKKAKGGGLATMYAAAPGAPFRDKEAQAIGLRLELLEKRAPVTPEAIVEDARAEESPLHDYFTWEDAEAARLWRLDEARNLTNHLLVKVYRDGKEIEAKGWHSLRIVSEDGEPNGRAYSSLATVSNSPELREQVIRQALKELDYWRRRYAEYRELFPVVRAIDRVSEVIEEARAPSPRGKGRKKTG
jgi:hypothetical protein